MNGRDTDKDLIDGGTGGRALATGGCSGRRCSWCWYNSIFGYLICDLRRESRILIDGLPKIQEPSAYRTWRAIPCRYLDCLFELAAMWYVIIALCLFGSACAPHTATARRDHVTSVPSVFAAYTSNEADLTVSIMLAMWRRIERFRAFMGAPPDSLHQACMVQDCLWLDDGAAVRDAWGSPLEFRHDFADGFVLTSAGRDRLWRTGDELEFDSRVHNARAQRISSCFTVQDEQPGIGARMP